METRGPAVRSTEERRVECNREGRDERMVARDRVRREETFLMEILDLVTPSFFSSGHQLAILRWNIKRL